MSYYTHVELTMVDGDLASDPHEQQLARVMPHVSEFRRKEHRDGFDQTYLDQIGEVLNGKLVLMRGYFSQAEEFVRYLSECFPDTTFAARGMGEEFEDLWHFEFRNGQQLSSAEKADHPAARPVPHKQLFTRVTDSSAQGLKSLVRPIYLKILLAMLLLFVLVVVITP